MPKKKGPHINLDKYLDNADQKYMTYQQAAKVYGIPYWSFVNSAKEAKATWVFRKTAVVDIAKYEKYLEEQCSVDSGEKTNNKKENEKMSKTRKEVENIGELVKSNKKKYVRYAEGAEIFSLGLHTFQELAKDAGAVRRVKRCVLVNVEKVEAFIESFADEEDY